MNAFYSPMIPAAFNCCFPRPDEARPGMFLSADGFGPLG